MSYQLGKNILATVTYYDVLNYPLTSFEIWKHLIVHNRDQENISSQTSRLGDVVRLLVSEHFSPKIDKKDGFYFLRGRESLIASRIQAEKLSVRKLRRMRSLAKLMACLPYVHMLGATGSLAMKHGDKGSDWDMFVVLRSGKIWLGRTLITGFLHLIGKRRHGSKVEDRACLNYFITDDNLRIGTKDLFSAHEYRFLIPLFNFKLFQVFEVKNAWIRDYKPNFSVTLMSSLWEISENSLIRFSRESLEAFFNLFDLEKWLASWQKEKIRHNPKSSLEGSLIEAHDRALIFLPRPQGPRVFQKFKERLGV